MATASQQNDGAGYAMLAIDELKLLIPQTQISSLEMSAAMEVDESETTTAGFFQFENKAWPIFCFSSQLDLLKPPPLNRSICVLMQTDSDFFGILCDHALLLREDVVKSQALSESMMTDDTPVTGLTIYNDEIITISSAERLTKLLPLNELASTEFAL